MHVAQAISDATNSSSLSWPAAVAVYVLIPLAVTGLIFTLVFRLSRPRTHDGFQVLGHPAELSRHERDEQWLGPEVLADDGDDRPDGTSTGEDEPAQRRTA